MDPVPKGWQRVAIDSKLGVAAMHEIFRDSLLGTAVRNPWHSNKTATFAQMNTGRTVYAYGEVLWLSGT
jgi:hypothetical protein